MNLKPHRMNRCMRVLLAQLCAVAIAPGNTLALAQSGQPVMAQTTPASAPSAAIPPEQLDSLVAPIALYPDHLLAQTLAASTYPLELMQLQQWLARNPGLKDKALADAVSRQPWDPSVQATAALPDVVKLLTDNIQWTTDLGNAFLAQQGDVMNAVQRMRRTAQQKGNLKSTPQQTVETQIVQSTPQQQQTGVPQTAEPQVVESQSVIVIEQAQPDVVYVPSYNPTVVYGAPYYPYPPIYYPSAGYYAAGAAISFGLGVAAGAAWGGGWGWGANWGHNDISVNNFNNFNRNYNRNSNINRGNVGNNWQHRPEHRGGAPYRDRATANRYGGTARGDSLSSRQANARQQVSRQGGNMRSTVGTSGVANRAGAAGLSNRAGTAAGNRAGTSSLGNRTGAGAGNRTGTANFGNRAGAGAGNRTSSANFGNRTGNTSFSGARSGDRVGGRDLSGRSSVGNSSAFGGGSQRYNGSSARASSNRGSYSSRSGGGSRSYGGGSRSSGGSRSFGGGGGRSFGGGGGRSRGGGGSRGGGRR